MTGLKDWLESHTALGANSISTYLTIVEGYRKYLKGREPSAETANRYLRKRMYPNYRAALRLYLKMLGQDYNSVIRIKQPKPRPRNIPTIEDMAQVVTDLKGEDKIIALIMLYTGCRCSEAFKFRRGDMEPDGKIILRTKGDQYREARLPPSFSAYLNNWLDKRGLGNLEPVFYTERSASINSRVKLFWGALNKSSRKVLKRRVGTHDFRRIIGILVYKQSGNDIRLLQRFLGHADVNTTMRYVRYASAEEDITKAMSIIDKALALKDTS